VESGHRKIKQNIMSQYDNTNRGALFTNTKKQSERHPDYEGQVNVDGVDWALSAWEKTSKGGKKYLSLSVKKPYVKESSPADSSQDSSKGSPQEWDNY